MKAFLLKKLTTIFRSIKEKNILDIYRSLIKKQGDDISEIEKYQLEKINKLIKHAYKNTSYYRNEFNENEFLLNNGFQINSLSELQYLPILSKKILNSNKALLTSNDHKNRNSYENSTGGSTGKPVHVIQDKLYQDNNLANQFLGRSWTNIDIFDFVVKLWGAERDLLIGRKPIKAKIVDILLNQKTFNSFKMSEKDIYAFVNFLNKKKPKLIHGYVQSLVEVAKFINKKNLHIEKQNALWLSAGTVTKSDRKLLESTFKCKSYSNYGTREAGAIAGQGYKSEGLHEFSHNVYIEIVDENGNLCKPGESGEILITLLHNYSMPLIRYNIEDIGSLEPYKKCNYGINYRKLNEIKGRKSDIFINAKKENIDGAYFTHMMKNLEGFDKYQFIQNDYEEIQVNIVKNELFKNAIYQEIEQIIYTVMGSNCKIIFNEVDEIEPTKTGKFLFTISKIKENEDNK